MKKAAPTSPAVMRRDSSRRFNPTAMPAAAAAALEEQASRLTEAVAVFRIQQQQQQQREASAVVKTVTPATPRKMAVADSEENWETF